LTEEQYEALKAKLEAIHNDVVLIGIIVVVCIGITTITISSRTVPIVATPTAAMYDKVRSP
jgi:hypothetical protein